MTAEFKDHFSDRAASYATFRPHYPPALAEYLASIAPRRETAWDVGCGSGQMSTLLAERFDRVIATDASAEQIALATPHPAIEYIVGTAEDAPIDGRSIDLIVVAQAAHWFDLPRFYDEARRVARPGGVVALVAYAETEVEEPVGALVDDFYSRVLGKWWPPERRHIETGYLHLDFPFAELPHPQIEMAMSWTVEQLIGYVSTWSAVRALELTEGASETDRFVVRVRAAWGAKGARRVSWPLKLRAGRIR